MVYLFEREAKEKWCPFARDLTEGVNCRATGCAVWLSEGRDYGTGDLWGRCGLITQQKDRYRPELLED